MVHDFRYYFRNVRQLAFLEDLENLSSFSHIHPLELEIITISQQKENGLRLCCLPL